jgi:hypothetical protein
MRTLTLLLALALSVPAAHAQTAQNHVDLLMPAEDMTREGDILYDEYTVDLAEGQELTVRMASPDFDTFIIVRSPSGEVTENDDFEGDQRKSQVDLVAMEAGTYTVWATAYDADQLGSYSLDIEPGAIASIQLLEGRLDPRDAVALKGEYVDLHEVEIDSGQPFRVDLVSYGFDGYLVVTSPSGQVWRNDDFGSTTLARVGPLPAEAGTWRIQATSARAEEVGAYDVRIITF